MISNEAGLALGRMGMLYRNDGGPFNSRLIVELYYNTETDVVARAQAAGRDLVAMFGSGWGYHKLWQQRQGDFRDWRVLAGEGTVRLHNLAATNRPVRLRLQAVAVNGDKLVQPPAGAVQQFPNGQLVTWTSDPVDLPPGRSELRFRDPQARANGPVLLVESLDAVP